MATLIELENRVIKLEERSSIQDETIKRMFDFIQRVIDDQAEKSEERSSIQDEAIKRISDFVQRVLDDRYEKKGAFAENKGDEDEQLMQDYCIRSKSSCHDDSKNIHELQPAPTDIDIFGHFILLCMKPSV